ncbi:hypothetical protein DTO271G3_7363 [Paecilomyces variotii]|nr:hypothetical protein DTO271G3_7363 [Paecilomyces variotii]
MASKLFPGNPSEVMVIRKVTPDIITLSVPFARFGIIKFGGRGTLVKLSSGSVAVFSPVALTPQVHDAIKSLGGPVKYIAAPDMEHHLYVTRWKDAFPDAQVLAPEGLKEKRQSNPGFAGTEFTHIFTSEKKQKLQISEEFDSEFETEYVDGHVSRELVFLHKRSRTLIEADLLFNLPATEQYSKSGVSPTSGVLTRIIAPLMSTAPPTTWQKRFIWHLTVANRQRYRESIRRIDQWDFDRLIPCHGDVIETGAKGVFRNVMEWFLRDN